MCQLLGLNSNRPTDICFSFSGFRARGGGTDRHGDGWGIAFFHGHGAQVLNDPRPSCTSRLAELVASHPFRSTHIIAHIRKATVGSVRLENTHPFTRELWGRQWVFAHNGTLPDFAPQLNGSALPVGCTDSERAFCWLIQYLRERFGPIRPSLPQLIDAVRDAAVALTDHGVINFLLSDGDVMFAHCSTRLSYVARRAPFRRLHLVDTGDAVDLGLEADPALRAVVIATAPLTRGEAWVTMPAGSLWCFRDGDVLATEATVPGVIPETASACA